jgi:hypothetical protein
MLFLKVINTKLQAAFARIVASDLGSGSTGAGTKFLADDMTWKTVSGGPGSSVTEEQVIAYSLTLGGI